MASSDAEQEGGGATAPAAGGEEGDAAIAAAAVVAGKKGGLKVADPCDCLPPGTQTPSCRPPGILLSQKKLSAIQLALRSGNLLQHSTRGHRHKFCAVPRQAVLEGLDELWDESQYAEEFGLDAFVSKLSSSKPVAC